jgi:hypothetical protein
VIDIVCADAVAWMEGGECPPCSIVTSPPDQAEIGGTLDDWAVWYLRACAAAGRCLAPGAPVVFYGTDRKAEGRWLSKSAIFTEAAHQAGLHLLWHKVALRHPVGATDLHRPGYSHLMAFGDDTCRPGKATPDVFDRGRTLYPNGMGLVAARVACEFAVRPDLPLVDPFCGRGTVPAVADALGANAIGVDIDPQQCEAARTLRLRRRD